MALLIVAATSWPASLFYVGRIVPPRFDRIQCRDERIGW